MLSFSSYPSRAVASLAILSLAANGVHGAINGHCPPLGPVLPAPINANLSPVVREAAVLLRLALEAATANVEASAISVAVKSIHQDDPFFEFHLTPPSLDPRGVTEVDRKSVYRLASVSKLFPILAALQTDGISLDDPITKYVPELRKLGEQQPVQNKITVPDWDDITLGDLAAHMGGIPADIFTDLSAFDGPWSELGFPPIDDGEEIGCSGLLGTRPCNDSDFWDNYGRRTPVYAPGTTPVYSNLGAPLIALAVERTANRSIEDIVKEQILGPAGMKRTSMYKPDDSVGVIPYNQTEWPIDLGFLNPTGSYYSNIADLLAFGTAILKHKLLPPAATRRWMKPQSFTSSNGMMVGAPWEILRTNKATKDRRAIDLYTKGGGLIHYFSGFSMIPDYDLVMTVLVAGPEVSGSTVALLYNAMLKVLLPAVEQAGKVEAKAAYGGTYSDKDSNSTFSLSLDDGPGFEVTKWVANGVDVIANLYNMSIIPSPPPPGSNVSLRMYPTNLETKGQTAWRIVADTFDGETTEKLEADFVWDQAMCGSWGVMDRTTWNLRSLDSVVFDMEEDGEGKDRAVGVSFPFFQISLDRKVVEKEDDGDGVVEVDDEAKSWAEFNLQQHTLFKKRHPM